MRAGSIGRCVRPCHCAVGGEKCTFARPGGSPTLPRIHFWASGGGRWGRIMANVLIVDDDVDGCRPLARLLEVVGHRPFFVHDGRAALTLLDRLRPDMI